MGRVIGLWISILTCLIALIAACGADADDTPSPDALRLVFYSSLPEIIQNEGKPGLAELATAIREQKTHRKETYLIHGGASLGPSLLGALDKGAHMIDLLNGIQPEFMAVMKREFSYGMDHLSINSYASAFPLITSNLVMADSASPIDGLEPYYLLQGEYLTIGFLTLTSENAINEYGATKSKILDSDWTVTAMAKELRNKGADALFIMADTDFDDLSSYRADGLVDGIFYTHNFGNPQSLDAQGTIVTEGALDGYLITLDLWLDANGKLRSHAGKLPLDQFAPDAQIAKLVASYKNRLQERLSPPIATLTTSFDTLRENVRTGENAFGNFITDAARDFLGTDIFLLNSGAIRGNRKYAAGTTINRGDVQRELPFGNRTAILRMTGSMLRQTIEFGLDCASRTDGCTLQVSNMRIVHDSGAPAGQRIREIWVAGQPLDDNRIYEVGMSDFMAAGNDGFDWLKEAEPVVREGTNRALWDLIAEYCENMGEIDPAVNGRITDVAGAM